MICSNCHKTFTQPSLGGPHICPACDIGTTIEDGRLENKMEKWSSSKIEVEKAGIEYFNKKREKEENLIRADERAKFKAWAKENATIGSPNDGSTLARVVTLSQIFSFLDNLGLEEKDG